MLTVKLKPAMFKPKRSKIERLDFIIAGTQKGGTSALHYHLDQHPHVTFAHPEEAHMIDHPRRHFFDDEERFAEGKEVDYDILHDGIQLKPRSLVIGSCTPIYTNWRPAMERIRDYHPGIKLIVLLRNPIERAFSQWNMNWDRQREPLAFLEKVADRIRGIASFTGYPLPPAFIEALPKLEIIATMSVGTDHIDLAAAKARGIAVTNAPDVLTDCVADLGIGLTINLARNLIAADRFVRAGEWTRRLFPLATKLGGATMGIVGTGPRVQHVRPGQ